MLIYDKDNQEVGAGGSGCACCTCTSLGYIRSQMEEGKLNRVLIVATGSLHSPTSVGQKETIPSISHCISLEVST